jgi:hypothetical protein
VQEPLGHVQKLAQAGLRTRSTLRDEILCQIMKQITNNPERSSTLAGWRLLCIMLGLFSPSKRLLEPCKVFLWWARARQRAARCGAWLLTRDRRNAQAATDPEVATIAKVRGGSTAGAWPLNARARVCVCVCVCARRRAVRSGCC